MEMKEFLPVAGLAMILVFCIAAPTGYAAATDAGLPGTSLEMLKAEFWLTKIDAPHQILLSASQIESFNQSIYRALPGIVMDMNHFPDTLNRAVLQRWLLSERLPRGQERYDDGELLTDSFYNSLEKNLNLAAVRESNPVIWGYTIRRTDLRTFPTESAGSEQEESDDFDLFQETAVNIAEPLAILHRSADSEWFYVQTYNYRGWLREQDVAIASSRQEWQVRRDKDFVMITGSRVIPRESVMGRPVADWRSGMGTRLPFLGMEQQGYAVEIPQRDGLGGLLWRKAWIHGKADVSKGVLPYTRAHVLRQAFKMLGENYGWGGLREGRDCSSFVMDVYAVFGIRSPRNADQQEKVPGRSVHLYNRKTSAERNAVLAGTVPGATLHMRNHVLMYLGEHGGKHYAIHSLGSYGDSSRPRADGSLTRIGVMRIVVGHLNLPLRSGRTFLDVLTSVNHWQP